MRFQRWSKMAKYDAEDTGPYSASQAALSRAMTRLIASSRHNRQQHPAHYWLNPFVPGPISEALSRSLRRSYAMRGAGYGPLAGVVSAEYLANRMLPGAGLLAGWAVTPWDKVERAQDSAAAVSHEHRLAEKQRKEDLKKKQEKRRQKAAAIGQLRKEAERPFDASLAAAVVGSDDIIDAIARNRRKHPFHYWLNPFVPGPIAEALARYGRSVASGMHGSWPGTILSAPTLGIAPAIFGSTDADQDKAREDYHNRVRPYEDA